MTPPAARSDAPRSDAPRSDAPRDAMPRFGPSAPPWHAAALAAVVVLACALASVTPHPVGVFWDDGVYLLSAQALAAGDGYRYMYLPGTPPAIHYPPAFPLLLAALIKVTPAFPANVAVLKMLNPLCLAVGVYGVVRLAVRQLDMPSVPAAFAVTVCALTAPVLVLTNVLLSESLFLAVLIGAFWLGEHAASRGGVRAAVIAGLAIATLTLVRTVGGVLLPAAVAVLWWRHRRREPALIWEVFARNVGDLWRVFGLIFAPRLPRVMQWGVAAVAVAALGVGLAALAPRGAVLAVFLVFYGGVVLFWPYSPVRFVSTVWPLAGVVLLAGARSAGAWAVGRWPHAPRAAVAVVTLLLVGHAAYAARGLAGGWASSPQRAMAERLWPLVEWTVTHARPQDIVASDAHVMIALYTGRTTMPASMLTPAEHVHNKPTAQYARELGALAGRYHPQLLVLSRETPELDAVPMWAQTPGAPAITALPPVPGGGAAFALRERP